jgi:pSer/pThr/pTyr-binding forkhead associated (FHA) protein
MKLVIEDEAGTRTVVPFTAEELLLGRGGEGVAWPLPDRDVSRRHARFVRSGGATWVEDLGSLTGTWLNGERIVGRRRLRPGDLVEIGAYDLVVLPSELEVAGPGSPPPLPAVRPDLTPPPGAIAPVAVPPAAIVAAPAQPATGPRLRLVLVVALLAVAALVAVLVLGR